MYMYVIILCIDLPFKNVLTNECKWKLYILKKIYECIKKTINKLPKKISKLKSWLSKEKQ